MMDSSNTNLFQGAPLALDNPRSQEEDEEIEEQKRRQEELEDLLSDGIHAFKYDDSTINSSTNVSFDGGEPGNTLNYKFDSSRNSIGNHSSALKEITQNYRDVNPNDQLKVLYEVRMREINSLREEFSNYQAEKAKEINVLKNKVTLSEAEIRHLQLSLTNLESLLVEKTDVINKYKQNLSVKDNEIEALQKTVDQLKIEICSYSSTVNELQLKQLESNPFNVGARNFKFDELQKAHSDQVEKLENLVEEQSRKLQILDQAKTRLEEDLRNLIKNKAETDQENNLTIVGLSKKLQSSQQQCKDLFTLGEAIKRESDHFKERLKQLEAKTDSSFNTSGTEPMDNKTLMVHLEKLKRMLLDKDIEMRSVQAKLRFYETDMNELFEFRELINNMPINGISSCNVKEHELQFVAIQKQLRDCQAVLTERNQEIKSLHLINKESREKIEEMLQQTRTDIQNLSTRYSLPQLEKMSNDLREAERTIEELRTQLSEKNQLRQNSSDKENFDEILAMVKDDLKRSESEIKSLQELVDETKKSELQLRDENEKLEAKLREVCLKLNRSQLQADPEEFKSLKSEYGQVKEQLKLVMKQLELHKSNGGDNEKNCLVIVGKLRNKMKKFQELLRDSQMEKAAIEENLQEWEGILSDFFNVAKNCEQLENELVLTEKLEELTNAKTMLEGEKFALEYQLITRRDELAESKQTVTDLQSKNEELGDNLEKVQRELADRENCLKTIQSNKIALEQQLAETQKQLNEARQETIDLQKQLGENGDKDVRWNLSKPLKEAEQEFDAVSSSETFQKLLQAELLKSELALRENLQAESLKRIQDIEAKYKRVLKQSAEVYAKEVDKLKEQDGIYRQQLSAVLAECGQKVMALEDDNAELRRQRVGVAKEFEVYRKHISPQLDKYKEMADQAKANLEVMNRKWENLLGDCIVTYADVEKKCHKRVKSITTKMNRSKREMELIEKDYSERMEEFKSKHKYKY